MATKTKDKTGQRKRQTTQSDQPGALNVSQVARLLGCCEATVRTYISDGKLVASKPGKQNIITQQAVNDFLEKFQVKPASVSSASS